MGAICGKVPFRGPFPIGHECVAEIIELGPEVTGLNVGQRVVVPWAVSCGACPRCLRGLTSKCSTTSAGQPLSCFGFGPASGPWGGMVTDAFRVPFATHMLVPVPDTIPSERVAAASDNLADAWRTVVPPLGERPGGSVLVLAGAATSIGLYACGLAVAHGAQAVDYVDNDAGRRAVAESFGARTHPRRTWHSRIRGGARRTRRRAGYDVVVEATSLPTSLVDAVRATGAGGICTGVGYYLTSVTPTPLMHMYATDITLHLGVSHARALLPDLLAFLDRTRFPAERVTTLTADWDDAPTAYTAKTTKLVLHRDPLGTPTTGPSDQSDHDRPPQ